MITKQESLTYQEMFNRAWSGLKSQNFVRCIDVGGYCVYEKDGMHCAWGWVDPENTKNRLGSVRILKALGVGLLADMDEDSVDFAYHLQVAHDLACTGAAAYADVTLYNYQPLEVENNLRKLAAYHNLTIPGE